MIYLLSCYNYLKSGNAMVYKMRYNKTCRKLLLIVLCLSLVGFFELGCKSGDCPAYMNDETAKQGLFKRKRKISKKGLYNRKAPRYYR